MARNASSHCSSDNARGERRLGVDDGVPRIRFVEEIEDLRRVEPKRVDEQRIELCAPSPLGEGECRVDASHPVRHFRELREVYHPGDDRDVVAPHLARPAATVPPFVRAREPVQRIVGKSEFRSQRSREPRMARNHVAHLAPAEDRELESRAEAVKRRRAGTHAAHPVDHLRDAERLELVLRRLEPDVVAEPLRLLVRVGVATDVHQQGCVVDPRPVVLAEADLLGESECDHALAEYVLHRLTETEIDAERESSDELGETDPRAFITLHHRGAYKCGTPEDGVNAS